MDGKKYLACGTQFTESDRTLLAGYFRLADTIADLIGPHCEVVIHSLESVEKSIVKIVNGHHTGRTLGSPITDLGLKMLRHFEQTGEVTPKSYFTETKDGSLLKSTTCILAGEHDNPIGLFCINMNLSHPFPEIIKTLMPSTGHASETVSENFSHCSTHVIEQALTQAVTDVESDPTVSNKSKKKTITRLLFDNGIFEFKEATAIVSEGLGITRHAVYKYIREFKN
ncbi:PAS domain-containing protein [Endozoicomonas sp. Mp262]|uniref:helix-turn-helix transcriptional regulator n=1 Tax=Endozoicomonas sp. Mp262 TaxID=2919499 RepID=UPI0021D8C60B